MKDKFFNVNRITGTKLYSKTESVDLIITDPPLWY